jgi:hypothetical protein
VASFDHFLVHQDIGQSRKLYRNLTPAERWCYVGGVLALAAAAPIRGRLLVGDERADESDVARQANVSVAIARATLAKLREIERLVPDEEFDCERVHDWDEHNPEPKKDRTAPERMRRYRERLRRNEGRNTGSNARNGNEGVTAPEVEEEVEGKEPPLPPKGGSDLLSRVIEQLTRAYPDGEWWFQQLTVVGQDDLTLTVDAGEQGPWISQRYGDALADAVRQAGGPPKTVVAESPQEHENRLRSLAAEARRERRART